MLDHLDDLESDFSVFHRVDDIYTLDGPRFFRLAARLPAYKGVMRMRLMEEHEKRNPTPKASSASLPAGDGKTSTGWQTMSLEQADASAARGRVPSHLKGERREVRRG